MIELSQEEATAVLQHAMSKKGTDLNAFDTTTRLSAVIGVVVAIEALQELGWKIYRPLESVSDKNPP